jgi:cell division protein FtsW
MSLEATQHATPVAPRRRQGNPAAIAPSTPDYPLIVIMATLLGLGLFMVYSASFTTQGTIFFTRQILWIALGVAACVVMALIPHDWWRRLAVPIMVGTVLLLASVLALGGEEFGATRRLVGGSLQPSEFAKLALVIYVAAWVAVRGDKISRFQDGLVPFLIILFGVAGLIAAERSLSVTIIVLSIGMTIFFVGGGNLKQLGVLVGIGLAALTGAMIVSDYPLKRAGEWYAVHFNPAAISPDTLRFLALLRTGGGIGTDPIFWQSKAGVPLLWSDYLFANIGKDLGLPGMLAVVLLYAALAYRGLAIALNTRDRFAALAAMGITTWITVQASVHIAASLMLIPTTGQPLPFMSYGGSSLLATMAAAGLLLSISRSETEKKAIHAHLGFGRRDWRPRLPHPDRREHVEATDEPVQRPQQPAARSAGHQNVDGGAEHTFQTTGESRPTARATRRSAIKR